MTDSTAHGNPSELPFVGRPAEMKVASLLIERALGGNGAFLTIAGEQGVGKSRLAHEISRLASASDMVTVWTQGRDHDGAPAYWPWIDVLTQLEDCIGTEHPLGLAGAAERLTATLSSPPMVNSDPNPRRPLDPYLLMLELRKHLFASAQIRPLMVVVDDLHHCDRDSVTILSGIAPHLDTVGIVVLTTYVDRGLNPVFSSSLTELGRLPWHDRFHLKNLSKTDVASLLSHGIDEDHLNDVVEPVVRQTDGNALLVVESARHILSLVRDGVPIGQILNTWSGMTANTLAPFVRWRLERLPDESVRVVEAAAILGAQVVVLHVAETCNLEISHVRQAVEEAVTAGLLEARPGDECRFSHDLIRRSVIDGLGSGRRSELSATVGVALERLRETGHRVDPSTLARLFFDAGREYRDRASAYLIDAGRSALEVAAYQQALSFFELAAARHRLEDTQEGEVLYLRAIATYGLRRTDESVTLLRQAFGVFESLGDTQRAVWAAEFDGLDTVLHGMPRLEMHRLRERAYRMVIPGSIEEARVLNCLVGTGNHDDDQEKLKRALSLARTHGDRVLEARVLGTEALLEMEELNTRFMEPGRRALAMARAVHDHDLFLRLGGILSWALLDAGRPKEAEQLLDQMRAVESRSSTIALNVREIRNAEHRLASYHGRWDEADRILNTNHAHFTPARRERLNRLMRASRKDLTELSEGILEEILRRQDPEQAAMSLVRAAEAARLAGNRDLLAPIVTALDQYMPAVRHRRGRQLSQVCRGIVALMKADKDGLAGVLAELADSPNRMISRAWGVLDRFRGMFCDGLGRPDEAERYFGSGVEFCRDAGYLPELARTLQVWSAFLMKRGQTSRASKLIDEGLSLAQTLGMPAVVEDLKEQKRLLMGKRADTLSGREVEVMNLIARGLSKKDVGDSLFISPHTVDNHLRSIYKKLGIHSRAELAVYAAKDAAAAEP